jgi:hypothetical protein
MTLETYFNVTQAAKQTNLSVVTIRDYLAKGKLPNATMTLKGKSKLWAIPLTDLAAAGLLDKVSYATEEQAKEAELLALETELRHLKQLLAKESELVAEIRADRDFLRSRVTSPKSF